MKPAQQPGPNVYSANECDSNADTCCLGSNFVILSYTNRSADVYPYDKSYEPVANVPIVSGATAYDCPTTNNTYILVFNESLYYGTQLDHSLWNPNQLRENGFPCWDNPYDATRELEVDLGDGIKLPLTSRGTKIMCTTRTPTDSELRTCLHV